MRDPNKTKQIIIRESSILFNTKGYKTTSLSDITTATQLTKGAIYRHFKDKSELEKECLNHMCGILQNHLRLRIKNAPDTKSKLQTICEFFKKYADTPPFKGGCPLMNAAIEADDGDPKLKALAKEIMESMHQTIKTILENGKKHNQVTPIYNSSAFASMMFGSLEGAIMMMKVTDDKQHLLSVITYLENEIDHLI